MRFEPNLSNRNSSSLKNIVQLTTASTSRPWGIHGTAMQLPQCLCKLGTQKNMGYDWHGSTEDYGVKKKVKTKPYAYFMGNFVYSSASAMELPQLCLQPSHLSLPAKRCGHTLVSPPSPLSGTGWIGYSQGRQFVYSIPTPRRCPRPPCIRRVHNNPGLKVQLHTQNRYVFSKYAVTLVKWHGFRFTSVLSRAAIHLYPLPQRPQGARTLTGKQICNFRPWTC